MSTCCFCGKFRWIFPSLFSCTSPRQLCWHIEAKAAKPCLIICTQMCVYITSDYRHVGRSLLADPAPRLDRSLLCLGATQLLLLWRWGNSFIFHRYKEEKLILMLDLKKCGLCKYLLPSLAIHLPCFFWHKLLHSFKIYERLFEWEVNVSAND